MNLIPLSKTPEAYLTNNQVIDFQHPSIQSLARQLARKSISTSDLDIAHICFTWVRDEIKHCWDYQLNPVTCIASDVLKYKTGFCYAKSHLLAALLRANNIPAGLCYQRLILGEDSDVYCLHGLNAIYLQTAGWYRVDPRGDTEAISTEFQPPIEKLAFQPNEQLKEVDWPYIYAEPLDIVTQCLQQYQTISEVFYHLPDSETLNSAAS